MQCACQIALYGMNYHIRIGEATIKHQRIEVSRKCTEKIQEVSKVIMLCELVFVGTDMTGSCDLITYMAISYCMTRSKTIGS